MTDVASVYLEGSITAQTAAPIWQSAMAAIQRNPVQPVVIDASRLVHLDNVGVALLFDLVRQPRQPGAKVEIRALAPKLAAMVYRHDPVEFSAAPAVHRTAGFIELVGRSTASQLQYLLRLMRFVGACLTAALRRPTGQGARWNDLLDIATECGANAVPVVLLVGVLMGVIIAFELGLVASKFGAMILVVDGVGVAVLRELGALMTAIVFAGRTGAAFAAQIGAQKVNEELDALTTFGLGPIEFLVLPRLLAAAIVVPMLTLVADVAGLYGGALAMTAFDVTFLQFYTQLASDVNPLDLLLGLTKGACFGITIALVGCHRGLMTGAGPGAVGQSATHAVVASIVLIIAIDGLFAVATS
jgi:phospholipid/cholesterol/gamma-HCH transport system permease protein